MIDVIIPVYKAEETLTATLASILEQTIVKDINVFIVIDGEDVSKYNKIIDTFNDLFPNPIDVHVVDKNKGPGYCRQMGINLTYNPYFTFIDADDTFAGAYSLEVLYKRAKEYPNASCIVGNFAEEQKGLKFFTHPDDSVWVFGKLYNRKFINGMEIAFNNTRANEDTGFNTKVKLCSNIEHPVLSIQDIVYYWHYKEDSITRKNNGDYSYGDSFIGYIDNMIEAINFASYKCPYNNGNITKFIISTMINIYIYYLQTIARDPKYIGQNFEYSCKYYKEVFRDVVQKVDNDVIKAQFAMEYHKRSAELMDVYPTITFFDFLDSIEQVIYK